jgi:hypothetical protein
MTSLAIADKGSGSTNELEGETVSTAAPSGTAALSAGDTTAADRSVDLKLSVSEELRTASIASRASVTLLPPEPVQGLDVR